MSAALQQAPAEGQTILTFAPRSLSAREFRGLATEVLDRLRGSVRTPVLQH